MTVTATRSRAQDLPSRGETLLSLAVFEGRALLKHPVVLAGALGSLAWAFWGLTDEAPVLNRISVSVVWIMLPLAMSVALVAGWATLRTRGHSDSQPTTVMPLSMGHRCAGIAIGLAWPAVATAVAEGVVLGWAFANDPVTELVWSELAVGPVYVVFAGLVSISLTRLMPHAATPLFAVLALVGLTLASYVYDYSQWGRSITAEWLLPMAWPQDIIPYELAFRPAPLHLGYLSALVLVMFGVATWGIGLTSWLTIGMGLPLAVILGASQLGPITEADQSTAIGRLVGSEADLVCEKQGQVTYCAMPGYENWIDDWETAAEPLLTAAPPAAATGMEVRQYPIHNTNLISEFETRDLADLWWWMNPSQDDYAEREVVATGSVQASWTSTFLIRDLANRLVGCADYNHCGESQNLTAYWLIVQNPYVQSYTVDDPIFGSDYASVADCMILEMWDNPDTVGWVLDNWTALTDPSTSYEQAGQILDVPVPAGYDENGVLPNGCP